MYLEVGTESYIVSESYRNTPDQYDLIKHSMNLFLELFGYLELRKENLENFISPNIKRLNWEILPPGRYPWDRVKSHITSFVREHSKKSYEPVALERAEQICKYTFDEVYSGIGGFGSYMAYSFPALNLVVV